MKTPVKEPFLPPSAPSSSPAVADWRAAMAAREKSRVWQGMVPTDPAVVATVVSIASEDPGLGYGKIRQRAQAAHGVRLAQATVANILRRHGVQCGRGAGRLPEMEAALLEGRPVSEWFYRKLLLANPALRERGRETAGPGERVCQTHFPVMTPGPESRVWVHAYVAVDTYGGMAMAELYGEGTTEAAVDFLHGRVLPFYGREGVKVACVETSRNRVYHGGGDAHVFGAYLRMQGIRHEVRAIAMPPMNGFMERFRQAFTSGFVQPLLPGLQRGDQCGADLTPEALAGLREKLAEWLRHYNGEEPQEGYRNAGKTPRAFWQGAGTLKAGG
ncbi:transposase ISSod13 [Opitutaceae bacterium TAV5]|nr:transposase ISSod13 [Opitutaceae bacterium TAV5]